jgi:hypothetical protein
VTRRVIGQVSDGQYKSGKPTEVGSRDHSGLKEFNRQYMQEQFRHDIVQPFKNGQPNPEYIEAWGKKHARDQFNIGDINDG